MNDIQNYVIFSHYNNGVHTLYIENRDKNIDKHEKEVFKEYSGIIKYIKRLDKEEGIKYIERVELWSSEKGLILSWSNQENSEQFNGQPIFMRRLGNDNPNPHFH